ncbi:MAG: hypothetical protein BWZ10_01436 [candidate division BRC1 bacterium ADurb.BinA364]|nr:MAG: hypothetical protein BWZ10_01436 [candidate division BRC1 bacterium ADurb.BinA364]
MDRHFAPGMRINGRMNFALEEGMQEFWIEAAPRDGADANPANNRASCPIQIGPPSNRDLEIVNLRLASEPVGIAPGQPLDIYIQVANRGPADVEGVFDVAIQGVEEGIARQSVEGPLRPNETRSTVIRAHAPANLANGLSLWAAVDSSNAIWESDETNNYTRLDLSGKILPAAPPPPPAPY